MLRRVALLRTEVSEKNIATIKRTKIIVEQGTTLDEGGAKFLRNFDSYKSHTA
jgi:hypothetical protein